MKCEVLYDGAARPSGATAGPSSSANAVTGRLLEMVNCRLSPAYSLSLTASMRLRASATGRVLGYSLINSR